MVCLSLCTDERAPHLELQARLLQSPPLEEILQACGTLFCQHTPANLWQLALVSTFCSLLGSWATIAAQRRGAALKQASHHLDVWVEGMGAQRPGPALSWTWPLTTGQQGDPAPSSSCHGMKDPINVSSEKISPHALMFAQQLTKERVGSPVNHSADPGLQHCAGTHGAGLQGDIKRRVQEAPLLCCRSCVLYALHLGMSSGIPRRLHSVVRPCCYLAINHEDSTHGNFPFVCSL